MADDQKNEEKKVAAEFPPATAIRSIATVIGGQTTTPGELATEETKNSLNAGSNMLQPSDSMFGAVFVDPIKIFITTILNSSSSILMKGLFRVLPKMEEDDIDFQNPGDDISQINNTCIPGDSGFSEGDPCAKNSDCKTCCCNTNYEGGVGDGILYCKPTSWCTSTR